MGLKSIVIRQVFKWECGQVFTWDCRVSLVCSPVGCGQVFTWGFKSVAIQQVFIWDGRQVLLMYKSSASAVEVFTWECSVVFTWHVTSQVFIWGLKPSVHLGFEVDCYSSVHLGYKTGVTRVQV